jgi:glucose/arabinose dehydrogenase
MKRSTIMKLSSIILVPTILVIGLTSLNCNSKSGNNQDFGEAIENYQNFCAGCHGVNLERFKVSAWMQEKGIKTAFESIKFGIDDIGMPAFEKTFNNKQIEDLSKYIKAEVPKDKSRLRPAVTLGALVTSEVQKFVIDTVVTGLNVPWGLTFLPNGDLLITERAGTLHRFSNGELSPPIKGLPPIMAVGQGGLMDIALHPNYNSNGWIYMAYSALNTQSSGRIGNTAVLRARLDGDRLIDLEVIYEGLPHTSRGHHFGCKLAFDGKGHLFFGIGDRGQHNDFPQTLDNHNGKIHRIMDDGKIPTDNPFVNTPNAVPSIYSYGHRNPQGTSIHPKTGELWVSEHGPKGGDELNLVKPGLNFGWPVISYGINYNGTILTEHTHMDGMEQPVYQWTPSIAPCGMTFVTGNRFKNWEYNLLIGSLSFQYLERVVLEGHSVVHREKLLEGIGRVRNVVMSPDGFVYVAIETPGIIVRLIPVE